MSKHISGVDEALAFVTNRHGPIVVGFDGSESADLAVRFAAVEAAARGVPLHIITASGFVASDVGYGTGVSVDPATTEAIREGTQRHVDAAVTAVGREFPDLDVIGVADVGPAAGVLRSHSADASAVVVGSHGRGGFLGALLGGTARQLATHSQVPTIVVRRPAPTGDRVVVGIDGSPDSLRALAYAFDFADRHGYSLSVMHTWDVPPIGALTGVPSPAPQELIRDMADNEVRWAAEELVGFGERFPTVTVAQKVLQGPPVKVLVDEAADAALLVVGSRGRGGFLGLVLGSVSHGVLHHATCNVAVVSART